MKESLVLFGLLLWSIDKTNTAIVAPLQPGTQPVGICIDVTLCQQPPYNQLCSKVPICPKPTKSSPSKQPTPGLVSSIKPTSSPHNPVPGPAPSRPTAPGPTASASIPSIPQTSRVVPIASLSPAKPTHTVTRPNTIVPSKSIHQKPIGVIEIQNNVRIEFGKKSNVTHQ